MQAEVEQALTYELRWQRTDGWMADREAVMRAAAESAGDVKDFYARLHAAVFRGELPCCSTGIYARVQGRE